MLIFCVSWLETPVMNIKPARVVLYALLQVVFVTVVLVTNLYLVV